MKPRAWLPAMMFLVLTRVHAEQPVPPTYWVEFATTKGSFVVEVVRACAPESADRFHGLVGRRFYDGVPLHRVVPGYVTQFGVRVGSEGDERPSEQLLGDVAELENLRGTIAFARAGRSVGNQVFINLGNNTALDRLGFAPFGRVVVGMEVVDNFYGGYGRRLDSRAHVIRSSDPEFLDAEFPNLDSIMQANFIDGFGVESEDRSVYAACVDRAPGPAASTGDDLEQDPQPTILSVSKVIGSVPTPVEVTGLPAQGEVRWSAEPPIVVFDDARSRATEIRGLRSGVTTLTARYSDRSGAASSVTWTADLEVEVVGVVLDSSSRGGDRVVPARDRSRGLPGGEKRITLEVVSSEKSHESREIEIRLTRTAGSSGSAVFESSGKDVRIAPRGEETFSILGGEASDVPRNMELQIVAGDGHLLHRWSFTVFHVRLDGHVRGRVDAVLPPSARDGAGVGPGSLLAFFADFDGDGEPDHDELGDVHVENRLAYGGLVLEGQILPSGIDPADFNRTPSRTDGFNFDRRISARFYDQAGCGNRWLPRSFPEDRTDDRTDDDEDLIADADIVGTGELYIWAIDTPTISWPNVPQFADIVRWRGQFYETVTYDQVPVAESLPWFWRHSAQNKGEALPYVQIDDVDSDNRIQTGRTELTANLQPSLTLVPDVGGIRPTSFTMGSEWTAGSVDGSSLHAGGRLSPEGSRVPGTFVCLPKVYLIHELREPRQTTVSFIQMMSVDQVEETGIQGEFYVGNRLERGDYDLAVVSMGSSDKLPAEVRVEEPRLSSLRTKQRIRALIDLIERVEDVEELVEDPPRATEVAEAIIELGDYEAERALAPIVRLLDFKDPRISGDIVTEKRSWADWYPSVYALQRIGESSAGPLLAAISESDRSLRFRKNAARVLVRIYPDTSLARQAIVDFAVENAINDVRRARLAELASEIPDVLDPNAVPGEAPRELRSR